MRSPCAAAVTALLLVLLLPFTSGALIPVGTSPADIQLALDGAGSGNTVVVAAGEVDLGSTPLIISKAGVSMQGAGPGKTIFKSSIFTNQGLLIVSGADPLIGTPPTIVEGITFLNSAVPPTNGPQTAVEISMSGPPGGQSVFKNCEVLNFLAASKVKVSIVASRWRVENNRFDNLVDALGVFSGSQVRTGNQPPPRLVDTVDITGNTIQNPDGFKLVYPSQGYYGLFAFDTASIPLLNRAHIVQNNIISGVSAGILISQGGVASSVTGFTITDNSITGPFQSSDGPTTGSSISLVNTALSLAVPRNWYGQAAGPNPDQLPGNLLPAPWIASFSNDPAKAGKPGFWPINIVLGNSETPGLTPSSISISPSGSLLAGSTFTLTANSQPNKNVLGGTLTVLSTPPGIICQPMSQAGAVSSLQTTCRVPWRVRVGPYSLQVTWVTAAQQSSTASITVQVVVCRSGNRCPWRPRTRGCASLQQQHQGDSSPLARLASHADLPFAGSLQYAHEWPACSRLGICLEGECALVMDHPACCIVPCAYSQGATTDVPTHPAASSNASHAGVTEEEQHADATTAGFWKSDELYCWRS